MVLFMRTTQEYFNLSTTELQEIRNEYGYTREECILFDESYNTQLFDSLEHLESSKEFYKNIGYEVGETLQMSNGRFALLLN